MSYLAYEPVSEEVTVTRDQTTARVEFILPWSDADAYAVAVVGGMRTTLGSLQWYPPERYNSSVLNLFCNSATYKPFGTYDATTGWAEARMTLQFGPLDQPGNSDSNADPTQTIDWSHDLSGEEMVLPKTSFTVGSAAGDPLGDEAPNPIKVVPEAAITATIKHKPHLDESKWVDYVGKVNSTTIRGFAAGKLLFLGVSTRRTQSSDGKDTWEYSVKFAGKYSSTWNEIFKDGSWVEIFPHNYESADLEEMLNGL